MKEKKQTTYKLRVKTTLLIMLLIGALLTTVMYINFKSSEKVLNEMLVQNAGSQVKLHAQNFVSWINTRYAEMETMMNGANLTTEVKKGKQIIQTDQLSKQKITAFFNTDVGRLNEIYSSFSITDKNGNSHTNNGIRSNIAENEQFIVAMNGEKSISNPTPSMENPNNLIVSFSIPIKDAKEKIIGALTGESLVNTVFKENTDFKVGKNDIVYIVNHEGTIVYQSNEKNEEEEPKLRNHAIFTKEINENQEGYHYVEKDDNPYFFFYAPIENTDWYLVLEVPESEFMTPLNELIKNTTISTVITVLLVGVIVLLMLNRIFRRLSKVSVVANAVSKGDLTVPLIEVKNKDEIGILATAVNHMLTNLKALFEQINKEVGSSAQSVAKSSKELAFSAEETTSTSKKIADMIEKVSVDNEKQVAEVEKNAELLEEMTQGINRISMSSSEVSNYSHETAEKASKGSSHIDNSTKQMDKIMKAVESSSSVIDDLKTRSEEIGNIIGVINGVTEQINMLSLNASIEAARAGEHGKGFKVVAEEVKKLAQQTSDSANKVGELIQQTQSDVAKTEETMKHVYDEVKIGTKITKETGATFVDILSSIHNVTEQTHEVSAVSEELLAGSEEVLLSFKAIINIIKENARNFSSVTDTSEEQLAAMKSVSNYAEDLSRMAEDLQELINKINL